MDLEAEIDRLYGLPLDEFVAQRSELAKQLRADGERAAADEVKELRKPTLGAWAINQATRRRTHERDELLAAGERLRAAHEALLSGGDAAALRDATRDERALVSALAETAAAIATEGGKGGAALLERLRSTLHAAAVDEEVREELAAGRMVREREASGLGMLGEVALPARGSQRRGGSGAGGGGAAGGGAAARGAARKGRGAGSGAAQQGRTAGAKPSGQRGHSTGAKGDREAAKQEREAAAEQERAAAKREHAELLAKAERALADAQAVLAEAESAHDDATQHLDAARDALEQAREAETEARRAAREGAKDAARRERELKRLRDKAPAD